MQQSSLAGTAFMYEKRRYAAWTSKSCLMSATNIWRKSVFFQTCPISWLPGELRVRHGNLE